MYGVSLASALSGGTVRLHGKTNNGGEPRLISGRGASGTNAKCNEPKEHVDAKMVEILRRELYTCVDCLVITEVKLVTENYQC